MTKLDPNKVTRNDSGMPAEEVIELLRKEGIELNYGDLKMLIHEQALNEARTHVAMMSPEARQRAMVSVDRALRASLPKVQKMTASRKRIDTFYSDLVLWTALQEKTAS